jgi:hypothetical protein
MDNDKFIGLWNLKSWNCFIDGQKFNSPFGEKTIGSLLYTKNGVMSAVLRKEKRANFKQPNLLKGSNEEKVNAVDSFLSYMGKFSIDNEFVVHHVEHSLLPNWQGNVLKRIYSFSNNNTILTLKTTPIKTSKNKIVTNVLVWENVTPKSS